MFEYMDNIEECLVCKNRFKLGDMRGVETPIGYLDPICGDCNREIINSIQEAIKDIRIKNNR